MPSYLENVDALLMPLLAQPCVSWYLDYKLWVGVAAVLAFYVMQFLHRPFLMYLARWIEIAGIDFIILHMVQFSPGGLGKRTALVGAGAHFVGNSMMANHMHWKATDKFEAANVYQDLCTHMGKVTTVFIGQVILIYFYMHSLMEFKIDFGTVSYGYWLASIIAVQMASMFGRGADSQLGYAFRGKLWFFLIMDFSRLDICVVGQDEPLKIHRVEMWIRGGMAFIINEVMRSVIGVSVPLILMQAETPMAFLESCLAVAFIFQLDDTSMGGTYLLNRHEERTAMLPRDKHAHL